MKHGARLFYAIAATLGAITACSMSGSDSSDLARTNDGGPGLGTGGTTSLGPGTPVPAEPEKEVDRAFRVPVVSGHWVWTANPKSGRVALIDAKTFTVKTALAGAGPTYLTALPVEGGGSRALVINSVSEDATLLSANEAGEIETLANLPIHRGANAWAVSPDGRFAIAWTDASALGNADPSEGFQDITVLDLGGKQPTSRRLSVGYRPARVFMDDDSLSAYVATEAGIDVVNLVAKNGALVETEIELSADPANDTAKRDVNMTADGLFAFVSRDGKDYVTVVDVAKGSIQDVTLPGVVTDLDLSADGSTAVAIIRERLLPADDPAAGAGAGGQAGQSGVGSTGGGADDGGGGGLVIGAAGAGGIGGAGAAPEPDPGPQPAVGSLAVLMPVASIFNAPHAYVSVALEEVFGSVDLGSKDGQTALLYSNGIPSTHLTLLGLPSAAAAKHRTVDLKLPVFSAVSTPDGAHAIALLKPPVGSKQPGAFAVVPVAKDLPAKIQGTQAVTVPLDVTKPAAMVAIDDQRALVTVTDGIGLSYAYLVAMPELTVDAFQLDSVPLPQASGLVLDANQAFVAQQHPEGRITFIDLDTRELHTLTGFELATQVAQ
ncbi:MAG TPA: hypothetical protein VHP33_07230 [Polyangiaceae bacterium]|nr:hypothetical protein [Polyangiaceae bacterium]